MSAFLSCVLRDGPTVDMPFPKPPKSKLKDLFDPKQKQKRPLFGTELHEYLKTYLVNSNVDVNVRHWNPTSLENVIATLQDGYKILKQHHARFLIHYFNLGIALDLAFDYFKIAQLQGDVPSNIKWAAWLKDNVGISASYDRQIRNISKTFGSYKRLKYLGISIKEFISRKEQIRLTFVYPDIATYWKQDIAPVS